MATILGATAADQETIRTTFLELYEFRSRFVHGSAFAKQALTRHLRAAREIARVVIVWFTRFTTHLQGVARRDVLPTFTRGRLLAL